jgi:hypothetical protein
MIKEVFIPLRERFKNASGLEITDLGFNPVIDETMLFQRLRKGWWHTLFFGANEKYHLWGLRIFPTLPYSHWPAIKEYFAESVWTVAPNLKAFPAMLKQQDFADSTLFHEFQQAWNETAAILKAFYEIAGGDEYHEFLTNYVMDNDNAPKKGVTGSSYLLFWLTMDKSKGHDILRGLIELYLKRIPFSEVPIYEKGLGHWESRILNSCTSVAHNERAMYPEEHRNDTFWRTFCQPHGYDPAETPLDHHPSYSQYSKNVVDTTCNRLEYLGNFDRVKPEYKKSPLYAALVALFGNRDRYIGVQHFEAAVLFDLEHKDPIQCWNSLVSAAYWSGQNRPETMLPAWQAAIELCDANNWRDAHEALVHQWDFYHDFKRRNNIP